MSAWMDMVRNDETPYALSADAAVREVLSQASDYDLTSFEILAIGHIYATLALYEQVDALAATVDALAAKE